MRWHLIIDGDIVGPLTEAEVIVRIRAGIASEARVRMSGDTRWVPLSQYRPFANAAAGRDSRRPTPRIEREHERRVDEQFIQMYIAKNGEAWGPFGLDDVRRYVSDGRVAADDLVNIVGQDGWIDAARAPELVDAFPPPPDSVSAPDLQGEEQSEDLLRRTGRIPTVRGPDREDANTTATPSSGTAPPSTSRASEPRRAPAEFSTVWRTPESRKWDAGHARTIRQCFSRIATLQPRNLATP